MSRAEIRRATAGGEQHVRASMRPPVVAGGNASLRLAVKSPYPCFNEAARCRGRKPGKLRWQRSGHSSASMRPPVVAGGNRSSPQPNRMSLRASMRPPVVAGGNNAGVNRSLHLDQASMRPPVVAGGNQTYSANPTRSATRFNEAARCRGRKRETVCPARGWLLRASMRPPVVAGGNIVRWQEGRESFKLQ